MELTKCVVPDCGSPIHLRGLCRPCYNYAASLVRVKLATWPNLERTLCVLPIGYKTRQHVRVARAEWFAAGSGVDGGSAYSADELTRAMTERSREYRKYIRKVVA